LGCGVGMFARRFGKQRYLGLDISPVAIQLMREQGFEAEVRDLPPIATSKFDTIVGLELLEHLDDDARLAVVQEAAALCKRSIWSVPNNCMTPAEHAEHRTVFTLDSFTEFLHVAFTTVQVGKVMNFGAEHLMGVCKV
jgi:2-polyprenyl-3-methyl-5-hydroxy-6-metoxy-1,4-benzoquinol methylase